MLAHTRLALCCFVSLLVVASQWSDAQIHGVAPSVTSFGFGGSNNPTPGTPASVTSLGSNGFFATGCCAGPLILSPFQPTHDRALGGHRFHSHLRFPVGVLVPAYVPYPVPYAVPYGAYDATDDDNAAEDSTNMRASAAWNERGGRYWDSRSGSRMPEKVTPDGRLSASRPPAAPAPSDPSPPVSAQPTTVLIYKDGRKLEVQNYAIVGGTLFEFAGPLSHKILLADLDLPATEKANDDRGVEFQVPAQKGQ